MLKKEECDFAKIYRSLCYDRDDNKFKANSEAVRLIADLDEVQAKIKHGTDQKIDGLEIVEAADMGNLDMIKVLCENGADLNARENKGDNGNFRSDRFIGGSIYYSNTIILLIICSP